jgi:hypothetical protein
MKVSLDFANHAMQTILGFLNKPPAQAAALVQAIQKTCGWMEAERFQKVCDEISRDMPEGGRVPTYKKFIATYNDLADRLNWRAHDKAREKDCTSCHGEGWVFVRLYNPKSNIVDKFNKPCPECRKDHPKHNAPMLKDWVEADPSQALTYPDVTEPTPAIARFLAMLYEEIPDDDGKAALEAYRIQKTAGILRVKPIAKKTVFTEVIRGLERGVAAPVTGAESVAQVAAPPDTGSEAEEEGGEAPPF